jgi:polysaccharide chain length determinant protein (PEP-CTERM system associated)
MKAIIPDLTEILRGLWQGRWVGLIVAWLVGLAGAAFIFLTPDRYEASARVYVDTQSILKPLLSGLTVQPNVEQEVAILSRTLISRPNMQKLIRMTDMDLAVKTTEERERLIDSVMRTLYIKSAGRDNLYTIGFTDTKPAQATRTVQSLLSIFVESGLASKSNDTGQAKRFIEEQIKAYEQRLTEAENRVKEFKLQNMDLSGAGGTDFFGSLAALTEALQQARLLLQEALKSRDALKQQIADEEEARPSLAQDLPAAATPELDARISTLNKNLDEMLLRYTESHPDVMNSRRIIKEVETQREEERKRLGEELEKRGKGAALQSGGSSFYPQLKFALAEAEAQVAGLQARVADYERRNAQLRDKARSVPEREAQFTQLNRDYAIQKQNYDALVSRREAALMSGQVEAATGLADFRIIDPPRVFPNPVYPNRKLLIPLVLLASLCAGIAASYFFSMVHPTFHDKRSLKRVGQRPVLGAVSLLRSPAVALKRRRSGWLFLGGLGALAASYSAAIAVVFIGGMLPY